MQKINETFDIDGGTRDRSYFRKVIEEEDPVTLDVVKILNLDPQ